MTAGFAERQVTARGVIDALNQSIRREIDARHPWPAVWRYTDASLAEFLIALSGWELTDNAYVVIGGREPHTVRGVQSLEPRALPTGVLMKVLHGHLKLWSRRRRNPGVRDG